MWYDVRPDRMPASPVIKIRGSISSHPISPAFPSPPNTAWCFLALASTDSHQASRLRNGRRRERTFTTQRSEIQIDYILHIQVSGNAEARPDFSSWTTASEVGLGEEFWRPSRVVHFSILSWREGKGRGGELALPCFTVFCDSCEGKICPVADL